MSKSQKHLYGDSEYSCYSLCEYPIQNNVKYSHFKRGFFSNSNKNAQNVPRLSSSSIMLVQNSCNKFQVTSCSNTITLPPSAINKIIEESTYLLDILSFCINHRSPLSFYVDLTTDKYHLYQINLLPIIKPKSTKVFVNISPCEKDTSVYMPGDYINIRSCIITQNDQEPRIINHISESFATFANQTGLKLRDIIFNQASDKCFLNFTNSNCLLTLKDLNGNTKNFAVHYIPYNCENNFRSLLAVILTSNFRGDALPPQTDNGITTREQEILNLAATGCTNRYIAHKLLISEGTVKKTLHNAYKKLGINSRMELIKLHRD